MAILFGSSISLGALLQIVGFTGDASASAGADTGGLMSKISSWGPLKKMKEDPIKGMIALNSKLNGVIAIASILAFLEKTGFWQITSGDTDMSFQS